MSRLSSRESMNHMPPQILDRQVRLIAFYLPQYHPIPENDGWWGKGFTEWTNVAKAKPLFPGHYQPHIPADLGFYDLRVPETRLAQAEMAREHGIEAFCYWHYWFAGDRLLERPFKEVLQSGEPDFPFCLAWANESWTGVWHGAPDRILKQQQYPGLADHEAHFYALLEAFSDERYVTVDGKPLLVVYRPKQLPDVLRVTDFWREMAISSGLKGLYLVGVAEDSTWDPNESGFDAVTLSNHGRIMWAPVASIGQRLSRRLLRNPRVAKWYKQVIRRPIHIYSYQDALQNFVVSEELPFEYHPCLVPNWDNTPRSGLDGLVLHNSTPDLFRVQVKAALTCVQQRPFEHRVVFVKSWNEWAEGNHLEPDLKFGRGYLEAIRDEVCVTDAALGG
jgi:lipopolysaccharide biosynthesis protein